MTLNQLVCRAASVYPDAYVLEYWDLAKQEPRANPVGGDTLAKFVAHELADIFEAEAEDGEQIASAVKAMQNAADDLQAVADALSALACEAAERRAA
jgi:hypothetical protein